MLTSVSWDWWIKFSEHNLHHIMHSVALMGRTQRMRTIYCYNNYLLPMSCALLQLITLMQMARASFDAFIRLHAVPISWWLASVLWNTCSMWNLSITYESHDLLYDSFARKFVLSSNNLTSAWILWSIFLWGNGGNLKPDYNAQD